MGNTDVTNNLPAVETTPAVSTEGAPASPVTEVTQTQAQTPAQPAEPVLTEKRFQELLEGFEKRVTQSAKDTAKATVHKAMGVSTKPEPEPAKPVQPTQPAQTSAQTQPAQTPVATEPVINDPILKQAYEWLQADGVDINGDIDPFTLEAYKVQAIEGVHLTSEHPELATIDNSSNASFIATTISAVQAAKARMLAEGTLVLPEDQHAALTPGVISGVQTHKLPHEGKSGSETLQMFFNQGR